MVKTTDTLVGEVTQNTCSGLEFLMQKCMAYHSFNKDGVSPLEKIVGTSLYGWVFACNSYCSNIAGDIKAVFFKDANENLEAIAAFDEPYRIGIWHQVKVGPYTADFVVRIFYCDTVTMVAVECDGHEFHERTKEQAQHDRSRDRYFQMQGLTVFRYTGSEIWKTPTLPADQVWKFAEGRVK